MRNHARANENFGLPLFVGYHSIGVIKRNEEFLRKLSIRQFAKCVRVSHVAVIKAIRNGRIEKDKNGLIDQRSAMLAWEQNTDLSKKREAVRSLLPSSEETEEEKEARHARRAYEKSRAVKEIYSARIARLEYERKAKNLVSSSDVKIAAMECRRIFSDAVLSIPSKICHELAMEIDPDRVHTILTNVIHAMLEELFFQEKSRIRSEVLAGKSIENH